MSRKSVVGAWVAREGSTGGSNRAEGLDLARVLAVSNERKRMENEATSGRGDLQEPSVMPAAVPRPPAWGREGIDHQGAADCHNEPVAGVAPAGRPEGLLAKLVPVQGRNADAVPQRSTKVPAGLVDQGRIRHEPGNGRISERSAEGSYLVDRPQVILVGKRNDICLTGRYGAIEVASDPQSRRIAEYPDRKGCTSSKGPDDLKGSVRRPIVGYNQQVGRARLSCEGCQLLIQEACAVVSAARDPDRGIGHRLSPR